MSDLITSQEIDQISEENNGGGLYIKLNITKKTEMNVFIYGGKTRLSSFENMTEGN